MADVLSSIVPALIREQLISDVLPGSFSPSLLFSIVWPNGKEVTLGNELAREDTLEEPNVTISPPDSAAGSLSYTLVMSDPDAPSRADPKYGQFRHWVITGLKLSADGSVLKTNTSTTPYRPPGPPPGSGLHRYTFILFEEPASGFSVPAGAPEYGAALEERRSWNAVEFGSKHGLKLVGANFFLVRSADLDI